MAQLAKDVNRELKTWFTGIATSLENDPDVIDAMPIEEVKRELKQIGIDAGKSYTRFTKRLAVARLHNSLGNVIRWLSPVWEPKWAGQPVTADDIPAQQYSFPLEDGSIDVSCKWEDAYQSRPAFMKFSWRAQIPAQRDFWLRIINPETQEIRYEECLGSHPSGEETFSAEELGFNPAREAWAISVYTT